MAQVSTTTGAFQELSLQLTADREGYVLVYTANQTAEDLDVFIDDLLVEHIESPVIRTDDYYPFGLAFNSSQRTGVLTNKYLYNGKELQTDLDLDWYDYGARFYNPTLARFLTLDRQAYVYNTWSPYLYAANDPIRYEDKNGDGPGDKVLGASVALLDNLTGGIVNLRGVAADYVDNADDYNMGDVASIVIGTMETIEGAAMIESGTVVASVGLVAEAPSGGTSTVIVAAGGAGIVGGLAVSAHGGVVVKNGIDNLRNQKGRLNAEGKSNQEKASDLDPIKKETSEWESAKNKISNTEKGKTNV